MLLSLRDEPSTWGWFLSSSPSQSQSLWRLKWSASHRGCRHSTGRANAVWTYSWRGDRSLACWGTFAGRCTCKGSYGQSKRCRYRAQIGLKTSRCSSCRPAFSWLSSSSNRCCGQLGANPCRTSLLRSRSTSMAAFRGYKGCLVLTGWWGWSGKSDLWVCLSTGSRTTGCCSWSGSQASKSGRIRIHRLEWRGEGCPIRT